MVLLATRHSSHHALALVACALTMERSCPQGGSWDTSASSGGGAGGGGGGGGGGSGWDQVRLRSCGSLSSKFSLNGVAGGSHRSSSSSRSSSPRRRLRTVAGATSPRRRQAQARAKAGSAKVRPHATCEPVLVNSTQLKTFRLRRAAAGRMGRRRRAAAAAAGRGAWLGRAAATAAAGQGRWSAWLGRSAAAAAVTRWREGQRHCLDSAGVDDAAAGRRQRLTVQIDP